MKRLIPFLVFCLFTGLSTAQIVQRAHGVVVGASGGVSFAAPTTTGNALVLAMAWDDAQHETLGPSTIHDGTANVWNGGSSNTAAYGGGLSGIGTQTFIIDVFNAASMQTLTFSGWNTSQNLNVWLYELSNTVAADNFNLFFYHDQVNNNDDATGGGIATVNPVAPGFTPGDGGAGGVCNFFIGVVAPRAPVLTGTVNTSGTAVTWVSGNDFSLLSAGDAISIASTHYTIFSVGSSTTLTLTATAGIQAGVTYFAEANSPAANITSVASPWTLDTVQSGYAASFAQIVGSADQQAVFTNANSQQYCSMYGVLATQATSCTVHTSVVFPVTYVVTDNILPPKGRGAHAN